MELWFVMVTISVLFTGLQVFIQKIGAERNYNSSLLNSYSAGISAVIGFLIAGLVEGYKELSVIMIGWGSISGLIYILGTNMRMDALRYIDTTIMLPLHKFVSPLIALLLGILLFNELLSTYEWVGIFLGMLVPLLLISRVENARQNNLVRGLVLMLVSAVLAALVAAINKEGTNLFTSVLLFAAVTNSFSAIAGAAIYRYRKKETSTIKVIEGSYLDVRLVGLSIVSGIVQMIAFSTFMLAYAYGGSLAVVYTIHSMYIVIPIILAIFFFHEHWNLKKTLAIILSIFAIGLMR